MQITKPSINDPIEAKIAWAEVCLKEIKERLLQDGPITDLLGRYREALRGSRDEMVRAGVAGECQYCEEKEGGSCCGVGLENRYSGRMLLINLLLGVNLPRRRYHDASCYFLGEKGCVLLARDVICVNYLCGKINDRIGPDRLSPLREKEGVELELLFLLNERIKKIVTDSYA